jgi:hypothetical protein
MKRAALSLSLLLLLATISVNALGGLGGGSGDAPPEDDTIKVDLKPLDENSNSYGWVRIFPDKFAVGANRLNPDTYYAVYLVSGDRKEPVTDRPVRRSFGDGEFKFDTKLKEPFGGEWDKVVVYERPNGENDESGMIAVLEGSLE